MQSEWMLGEQYSERLCLNESTGKKYTLYEHFIREVNSLALKGKWHFWFNFCLASSYTYMYHQYILLSPADFTFLH